MRLSIGSCIDRYGTRLAWAISLVLFAAVCFAHVGIASCTGVAIYALRILFCCAMAGGLFSAIDDLRLTPQGHHGTRSPNCTACSARRPSSASLSAPNWATFF